MALVHLADGQAQQGEARELGRSLPAGGEEYWEACLGAVGLDRPGLETCRQRYQAERRARQRREAE